MDKILITGVAGFLGSHLANFFIKKNFKVVGVDNLLSGDLKNVNDKVEFHNYNCQNFEEMNETLLLRAQEDELKELTK